MIGAALTGLATGLALIVAIGAQNAFILRQGLLRAHVLPLCLFCALSDAVLILAGVAGFGAVTAQLPALPRIMAVAGAAFLIGYGALRLRAALRGDYAMTLAGQSPPLGPALALAAAFTWANPHVYLDTLGLVGAVSTQFAGPARWSFAGGAVAASFLWFFGLGYGARVLAPVMRSARAWRRLDLGIALLMWALAAGLLLS